MNDISTVFLNASRDLSFRVPAEHEEKIVDTLFSAYAHFLAALPTYIERQSPFTTPLLSILRTTQPLKAIFREFQDPIFSKFREKIISNHKTSDVAILAKLFEDNSPQHFAMLLSGTPFEQLASLRVPIFPPEQTRYEGTWIVAPPGRGKTTLLSNLLKHDLDAVAKGAASVIIMDSKGELINHARRLKRFGPGGDLEGKLTLIEPTENLALNPLDLGDPPDHSLIEYVILSLGSVVSTPQSTLMNMIALACSKISNADLATFRNFLTDNWRQYDDKLALLPEDERDFFYKEMDGTQYRETKQAVLARLRSMTIAVPLMRSMFRASKTLIKMGEQMDAGKVIIIDNTVATLGKGSEFFSRFFVALVLAAAQQRARPNIKDEDKLPCYFYIDECDTVIANDPSINVLLSKCRSQKIAMIFAHQKLQDIKSDDVKAALGDCAIRMANSDEEAEQMARRLRTTPDFLRALDRGQFAMFIRDYIPKAVTLDVGIGEEDGNHIRHWPKMSDAEFADIQTKMREAFCQTPPSQTDAPPQVQSDADDDRPKKWIK